MNDVFALFSACFASSAMFTSACALLVVPAAAWVIVMLALPTLRNMNADSRWQAPLSAAAAALPGVLFVVIGLVSLRVGLGSDCLQLVTGRFLYGVIAGIAAIGLLRAITFAYRRRAEVRSLLAAARAPGPRERFVAAQMGLEIRTVPSDEPFVFLAGIRCPTVLISTEAHRRLSDAQLEAAIRHEAAHVRHGDQIVALLVTFIADFVPLPVAALIAVYRRAREFAADEAASREADPCELAAALLALARARYAPAGAAAFAEPSTVRARLSALLAESSPRPARWRRIAVAATLLATFAAGSVPAVTALLAGFHCTEVM